MAVIVLANLIAASAWSQLHFVTGVNADDVMVTGISVG